MIGFKSVDVYNSIFNLTEDYNKFQLYAFHNPTRSRISYEKLAMRLGRNWKFQILHTPIYMIK